MAESTEVLFDERVTKEKVFAFLEGLRRTGVTNMFGAGPYVSKHFGVDKERGRKLLVAWMESYGK